jgi:hypothetical protein
MVEARPDGVKATGQFWKGQDQIWVGHGTVAWAVMAGSRLPHHAYAVEKDSRLISPARPGAPGRAFHRVRSRDA